MSILKKSIENVGILVPILVYRKKKLDPSDPKAEFVILDGERRWLCAMQIEKEREERKEIPAEVMVPANIIAEPSTLENILRMFTIHHLRESWELAPTALKLEVVMRYLKSTSPKELADLTGLTEANVKRCQILLTFDKSYLDMSLRQKPEDRITGDFFVQMYPVLELIKTQYPELYKGLGRKKIIDGMVEKYEAREIHAVTEFRDFAKIIRAVDVGASPARIERVVRDLVTTSMPIRAAYKREAKEYWQAEKVRVASDRLVRSLNRLEGTRISRRAPLFASLEKLRHTIDRLLKTGE